MGLPVTKAHAYGNDFLLIAEEDLRRVVAVGRGADPSAITRAFCNRHEGIGADGLILYELHERGARMTLYNADGGAAELSGNGLRCLAALVVRVRELSKGASIDVDTSAGARTLELLGVEGTRSIFRASMGEPQGLEEIEIATQHETVKASVLSMGNPQCVVLGTLPDEARFKRLGPSLSTHPMFPAGTNVEFAQLDAPDRITIRIWERGVGPTSSSGTGTCASAVAAAAHGGARRDVQVHAPGGTQRVEWRDDGVYLTGWAEIVFEGEWVANLP
jgi:diaminopimelate epimerase